MNNSPLIIKQAEHHSLLIEWDDHHKGRHLLQTLRKYCPCASCKSDREANEGMIMLPVLASGQNELSSIEKVGSYALQFVWADGHKTGIYTFEYLRHMCECDECRRVTAE